MARKQKLTAKQEAFVREYLIDLNATQAAVRAGYSQRRASEISYQLLQKTTVQKAIEAAMRERRKRTEVTVDRVVEELRDMAFYDPADLALLGPASGPEDIAKLPEDVRRAIVGWSWDKSGNFTVKLAPKVPALELLGRHLAMFKDKLHVDITGDLGVVFDPEQRKILLERVASTKGNENGAN